MMFSDISPYGTKVLLSLTEKSNKNSSFLSASTIDCFDATLCMFTPGSGVNV